MHRAAEKRLTVAVSVEGQRAIVRFIDTGPGIARPDRLFQPFQQAADGAGLGLYLSRALVRSFAGELKHEPQPAGCCFAVELVRVSGGRLAVS
jgi:signal transduction histidine kinase